MNNLFCKLHYFLIRMNWCQRGRVKGNGQFQTRIYFGTRTYKKQQQARRSEQALRESRERGIQWRESQQLPASYLSSILVLQSIKLRQGSEQGCCLEFGENKQLNIVIIVRVGNNTKCVPQFFFFGLKFKNNL